MLLGKDVFFRYFYWEPVSEWADRNNKDNQTKSSNMCGNANQNIIKINWLLIFYLLQISV